MTTDGWDPRWELGPDFIPKRRYTSRSFFELEMRKLWPRVWQVAGREDELRETGSYLEYRIGDQSVLVVRVDPDTLKAYVNSCRHRGTRLAAGCGRFEGGTIRCPFHGWVWHLDGEPAYIPRREEFSAETLSDLALTECRSGSWGGFVFVNLDPDAPDLDAALAPATRFLDPMGIERMGVLWHKQVELPVNWKAALDAFTESYHVAATHPEYAELGTDANRFVYHQDPGGHSHYAFPPTNYGNPGEAGEASPPEDERESFYRYVAYNVDELGAMYTERDRHLAGQLRQREIPAGSSLGEEYAQALHEYARGSGFTLPSPTAEQLGQIGVHLVFPHLMLLPTLGNALAYRARPDGLRADSTLWDIWSLTMFPDDDQPAHRVRKVDWRDPEQVGRVLFQDFSNMLEARSGMRNRGFEKLRLNTVQELNLLHLQREIDRYLKA
ncbi:MAG: aromatic ring-hydroxylating dioxygenase subunit alpha [Proteobacteria bacterium]|nr:aromatic ring-hydroxylating dioxygenase subunit alpha [Pseudomonadota bacterium]